MAFDYKKEYKEFYTYYTFLYLRTFKMKETQRLSED